MDRGCRNFKKGDVIKGLELVSEPYKIPGSKEYRAMVKCLLCDSEPFETVLSDTKRRVFDGCGCQINMSNSSKWKSFEDWCIENNNEALLDLWDYDLNNKTPDQISCCTADSYYFKCGEKKHPSSLHQIQCIATKRKNHTMCSMCNSFAQYAIDRFGEDVLDVYWDYEKNTIDPWKLPHNSKTEVWIKCVVVDYHESYLVPPKTFLDGCRCPYCSSKRVHPNDSFASYCIKKYGDNFLELYWDYELNTVNPWSIAPQSNIYVYFKCDVHGAHRVSVCHFYKTGILCSECIRELGKSKLQAKVENYISDEYGFDITHEYNCSIKAANPKNWAMVTI